MLNKKHNIHRTYIIAEAGVNHNGSIYKAKKLVDAAKKAGANAVKFQSFNAVTLSSNDTPKTNYQKKNTDNKTTHKGMLHELELSNSNFKKLYNYAKKKQIDFFSTPYDVKNAIFLKKLGVKIFKIASADLHDIFLHKFLAKQSNTVIISTGMSNLSQIKRTLKIYEENKKKNIFLLHCTSNYPCSDQSINLRAIKYLKKNTKYEIGFSDHSRGNLASCLAVGLGAKIIEKHITLNKRAKGPDHKSSLNPVEFKNFVNKIRKTEIMLGKYKKKIQKEEINMLNVSRKSIFTKKKIKENQKIKLSDLHLLRPGTGYSSFEIDKVIGKRAKKILKKIT